MKERYGRDFRRLVGVMSCLWLLLPCGHARGEEAPVLKDETDRINYSVGYQIGGDFQRQGIPLNREALLLGIESALDDNMKPLLTPEEMQTTLIELKKKIVAAQQVPKQVIAEKYRGEGREFLVANAAKEGVVTLPSGLQYRIVKEGEGAHPGPQSTVTVNYRGTLIDGSEFDSSYREGGPETFTLAGVIPGWKEAIPLMRTGSIWEIFLPADLAFGERGPLADRTVIYEIELVAIQPANDDSTRQP